MSENIDSKKFRYYQQEADDAIYEELRNSDKCIVKMFCGTGKSLLMRKCKIVKNQKLVVYVFPSLSLIDQFCNDYFVKVGLPSPFKISSDKDMKESEDANGKKTTKKTSTTNPEDIINFIKEGQNKIICVTYQSYDTLLKNLSSNKIDVCIYDEAHHAVGETYQKLIFEQEKSVVKQIFFTATPKNANDIIMYDRNNLEAGMCGKLVYDYSYLQGLNDEYVNPFQIRVDMYTENTNKSIYESIARAILVSGNNRVLTFHADVSEKSESKTSVLKFVDETDFVRAFIKVLTEEFPEKAGTYTKFKMIALDASIPTKDRRTILDKFDTTSDNEVYIISSCETIGEGIDTKKANMCVFVDPKSSFVKIIQNIGRIVRRQSKSSTVLIPCWVDKDKYIGCDGDREKCDEVIRSDLNKDGNFNAILNVLSALRQENEDLYYACLNYGKDIDDKSNYSSSIINSDSEDEYSENSDSEDTYPDYEDSKSEVKQKHKINISFHTNDEIKVLWKITSDIDIMKNMCSCVLECEVISNEDMWFERFEELKKFIDENKRRPNKESFSTNEKQSGHFMTNTIRNYKYNKDGMKKEDRRCVWENFCKDYNKYMLSDDEIWFDKLSELITYFDINKKRPSDHSTKIGKWLTRQIENYKSNTMPENRIEKWELFWNAHSKYFIGLHDKWFERFNQYEQYIKQYQSLPLVSKSLGKWGKDNDKSINDGKMNNERFNKWNELKQKYSEVFQDVWFEKLIELSLFIKTHEKLPVYSSTKTEEEKIIAQWNSKQIGDYKSKTQGMKDKIKYEKWTEHILLYNELYLTQEENWLTHYEKTAEYMKNKKKRPSAKNSDENVRALGSWLSNNLLKLTKKSKGFNSENEKCKFVDLILNYQDLFHKYLDIAKQIKLEVSIIETQELPAEKPKPKKSMKLKEPKKIEPKETTEQRQQRNESELSALLKTYKKFTSQNMQTIFKDDPKRWYHFHDVSGESEKSIRYEDIPRNRIIQELDEIEDKRTRCVVDMGCGKAQIADHFVIDTRFTFINYDHVSSKENVLVQDISKTPLENGSVDICILCLAMWGSNCEDYVREARRILCRRGELFIIEPTLRKRWTDEGGPPAGKLASLLEKSGFKIVKSSIEKFCLFICTKM
jgi:superfamily II DNA or RNA helicase